MADPHSDPAARQREIAGKARVAASESFSELWWTFLVRGALALALGIAALFWPTSSVSLLLRIAGFVLVLDGATTFFGMKNRIGQEVQSASGIVSALIGAVLLVFPSSSARFAFLLLGVWALVMGAGYLLTWWRMPQDEPERKTARNVGAAALLAGLALIIWPGSGLVGIGWIIAIFAFLISALMFFLASRFKRLNDRVKMKI